MQLNHSNNFLDTILTAPIGAGDLTMTIAVAVVVDLSAPFSLTIDPDSMTDYEVVLVTAMDAPRTTLTITRGYDGTAAKAHAIAGVVRHCAIAGDLSGNASGSNTEVQVNVSGLLSGDAGLTYAGRQLIVSGDTDKTTPLMIARSGDFHASAIALTGIPNADLLYTALAVGSGGNSITITYDTLGINQPLAVAVVGSDITVHLATDGGGTSISPASDVLTAVNGDPFASVLVTATLAPGNDGSGIASGAFAQLSGGAIAADTAWIDERGRINIQTQTGLGDNTLNVRDTGGTIVAHIDNDGGVVFSGGNFTLSQVGDMTVNAVQSLPLVGNTTLRYEVNGFVLFSIAAGGGYGISIGSPVATDILLNVAAGTGQTGDLFCAFDETFTKTVRILPAGDMQFDLPATGPILIDRTTATRYRLFVDNGVLGIEAA